MTRRDLAFLAYRSMLLALIVAGTAFLFITPAGLIQGQQTMAATLREVSAGVAWNGMPQPENPDVFILNIQISDQYRTEHPNFAVSIRLEWDEAQSDFDLLVNKDGKRVDDSGQGRTSSEEVLLEQPKNGIYHVLAQAMAVQPRSIYSGRVKLLPSMPEPAQRTALYREDTDGPSGPEFFQFVSLDLSGRTPTQRSGRSAIEIDAYGQTFLYLDSDETLPGQGKPIIDRKGTLVNVVTGSSPNELFLSMCSAPCERSILQRIYRGPSARDGDTPRPAIAMDRAGGLHVAFRAGNQILLMSSADGGSTWKAPVAANDPANKHAAPAGAPGVFSGDSGRVGVLWSDARGNVYYAFTPDAYAPLPTFTYVLAGNLSGVDSLPSAAIDPFGNPNILIGSTILLRQVSGAQFFFGPFIAVVGELRTESGPKQVSFSVRQEAGGTLTFTDERRGVSLQAGRLTSSKYEENRIALTGSGKLSDGTPVTFTVLTSDPRSADREFSISMSNGYFAAGPLAVTPALELKVQTVTREISHIDRPARSLAQP